MASELLENLEEMIPQYYMHSYMSSLFTYSTTQYYVTSLSVRWWHWPFTVDPSTGEVPVPSSILLRIIESSESGEMSSPIQSLINVWKRFL